MLEQASFLAKHKEILTAHYQLTQWLQFLEKNHSETSFDCQFEVKVKLLDLNIRMECKSHAKEMLFDVMTTVRHNQEAFFEKLKKEDHSYDGIQIESAYLTQDFKSIKLPFK